MKFFKLDLLTLLISLFLFSACENTSTIGLEVDPSIAVHGTLVDTITIRSETVAEPVAVTYGGSGNLARYPLGFLTDPLFGTTDAALAMSVNLPSEAYDFGANPILDSAVLVLPYSTEFYGDSTSNYSVEVHQLSNNLAKQTSFPADASYSFDNLVLGSRSGRIYPTTPFKIYDVINNAKDTLKTVVPQLRIKLSTAEIFGRLVNQSAATRKYNSYFNDMFKGLYVQMNKSNTSTPGGIMFFNFSASNANLALYYRKDNAANTTGKDTIAVNFPIALPTNPVAAKVVHNYVGTAIESQLDNPATQYAETYVQAMGGVRTKLSFPYLQLFSQSAGKIAINKAELVVDVKTGSDILPFAAAPRLALYRYDIAEQRKNIPDNDIGSSTTFGDPRNVGQAAFGGYFNTATRQYVFVVTAYLQDLIDGKTTNYGTYLAPTPQSIFEYLRTSYNTASRAVLGTYKKNPATGDAVMKLNVYYNKIK